MLWNYVKKYLHFAVIAALFMVGEVTMDLLQPQMMSVIVDDGVLGLNTGNVGDLELVLRVGLQMIGLVLVGGLCGSLNNVFVHLSSQNIANRIRKDCFRNIMRLSLDQTDRFSTGSLVTRVTNDVTQTQNMLAQFVRGMIRTGLLLGGSLFCLFQLQLRFGLLVLCAIPFMAGCMLYCLVKANPMFYRLQAQLDRVNSILQENIAGARIVKASVREEYEKEHFQEANHELVMTQRSVLVLFACMTPCMNIFMNLAVLGIIYAGSIPVDGSAVSPGVIMAAITYTTQLLNSILMLVMLFQNIVRGIASWKRIKEVLVCEPSIQDGSQEKWPAEKSAGEKTAVKNQPAEKNAEESWFWEKQSGGLLSASKGMSQRGRVELRNVSFSYPDSEERVLRNINLTVEPGETLAILGTTGCGKTSLVQLIPRFYDATEGQVLVDGVDVRDYSIAELRSRVAIALQRSELFSQSIEDNLRWGRKEAAHEEIKEAAQIAQAEEFIQAMPQGYETLVAERGMSLSGGQKQRLSIARALLKSAEIVIFDDASSALDLKTEANLYREWKKCQPDTTKLMIVQRIASARYADRIAVLSEGRILACASHEELMKSCRVYQDIYASQFGKGGLD